VRETVIIERRFRGPPSSANGGYACGLLGTRLDGPAQVTLRSPPPLDTPLAIERDGARVLLRDGETLVAEAAPTVLELDVPPPPSVDEAAAAAARYPGFDAHPFPSCFVCGPAREPGDGLRIFPGRVEGRALAAAPWRVEEPVAPTLVWAALDCPSWFGFHALHEFRGAALLGRLTAEIDGLPRAGETHVLSGWLLGVDGRKIRCGSALHDAGGRLLARALATWIQVA
jgi:hypothetical protein